MVRAVLFDLDDTLVDHRHANRAAIAGVRVSRRCSVCRWAIALPKPRDCWINFIVQSRSALPAAAKDAPVHAPDGRARRDARAGSSDASASGAAGDENVDADYHGYPMLSMTQAARFADIALANVVREYPNKQDHVLESDGDHLPSRVLHPAFHGSFDWHSCVHMHWLLVHVRRHAPDLPQRNTIDALLDRHLTPSSIAGECAYLTRPGAGSFERTYGWAWLLKLADELALSDDDDARRWTAALAPLAAVFVARYVAFLPRADFPIRYGIHPNSAFGLAFALDHARRAELPALEAVIVAKARAWYGADRDALVAWEPSGSDFLSPALIEADLMRRILPAPEFAEWLECFLPGIAARAPATLFTPVTVSDRADPQIVHLDGLNLSRAWCWRGIAAALPPDDPRVTVCRRAWADHLAAGLAALEAGDYGGSHWLASFAALALSD